MQGPPELGHAVAAFSICLIDPEDGVLVRVEGDRTAMGCDVFMRLAQVIEGGLRGHESRMHQLAGGIIDISQKRALWATVLEPPMLGAVDLDQFAPALAVIAWLVHGRKPSAAIQPQTFLDHPFADRLSGHGTTMGLPQLLSSQRRTEVWIALLDDRHDQITDRLRQAVVARFATPLRYEAGSSMLPEVLQQPEDLSAFEPEQAASVPNGHPTGF